MGYLGRRIGLSQDKGDSTPGGADGAVGGGILDLFAQGYFERQDKIYNAPGSPQTGIVATGGAINDYTDSGTVYRSHTFTSSGSFVVTNVGELGGTVDILSVGGGGGGGYNPPSYAGSGGGAGGVHYRTGIPASVATYPVTIGGGGSAGQPGASTSSPLAPFTAAGGGGGASNSPKTGGTGASSGGGSGPGGSGGTHTGAPGHPGGTDVVSPTPNANGWGNGGDGPDPNGYWGDGSGGGGAGGVGQQQATDAINPGDGGIGVKYSTAYGPTNVITYAGGGSGGAHNGPVSTPAEGRPEANRGGGGGGGGTPSSDTSGDEGDHAVAGTGGGGGGAGNKRDLSKAGNGGSGTLIIRYAIANFQTGTKKATGGLVSFNGGKAYHVFYTSQNFIVTDGPVACDFLVVGGGGAGGVGCGGGGGAGGYRSSFPEGPGGPSPSSEGAVTVADGTYAVTIGSGGSRRGNGSTNQGPGDSGGFSNIAFPSAIRAEGGGGGGNVGGSGRDGQPGGSGGGGNYPGGTQSSGNRQSPHSSTPVPNQGYPGGTSNTPANYGAGGGGGAGAAGADGTSSDGGDGGAGKQNTATGVTLSLAGGGGGNVYYPSSTVGDATHGGGQGAPHAGVAPLTGPTSINGHTNTGGGGGGGLRHAGAGPNTGIPPSIPSANTGVAGQGGSGLVIIAYPV
tara:strand:+ start:60 stop:2087 length:2028 start_codon:yes stop_codon:yes gene_type:complete